MESDLRKTYEDFLMYGPSVLKKKQVGGTKDICIGLYDGVSLAGNVIKFPLSTSGKVEDSADFKSFQNTLKVDEVAKDGDGNTSVIDTVDPNKPFLLPKNGDVHPDVILFIHQIANVFAKIQSLKPTSVPIKSTSKATPQSQKTIHTFTKHLFLQSNKTQAIEEAINIYLKSMMNADTGTAANVYYKDTKIPTKSNTVFTQANGTKTLEDIHGSIANNSLIKELNEGTHALNDLFLTEVFFDSDIATLQSTYKFVDNPYASFFLFLLNYDKDYQNVDIRLEVNLVLLRTMLGALGIEAKDTFPSKAPNTAGDDLSKLPYLKPTLSTLKDDIEKALANIKKESEIDNTQKDIVTLLRDMNTNYIITAAKTNRDPLIIKLLKERYQLLQHQKEVEKIKKENAALNNLKKAPTNVSQTVASTIQQNNGALVYDYFKRQYNCGQPGIDFIEKYFTTSSNTKKEITDNISNPEKFKELQIEVSTDPATSAPLFFDEFKLPAKTIYWEYTEYDPYGMSKVFGREDGIGNELQELAIEIYKDYLSEHQKNISNKPSWIGGKQTQYGGVKVLNKTASVNKIRKNIVNSISSNAASKVQPLFIIPNINTTNALYLNIKQYLNDVYIPAYSDSVKAIKVESVSKGDISSYDKYLNEAKKYLKKLKNKWKKEGNIFYKDDTAVTFVPNNASFGWDASKFGLFVSSCINKKNKIECIKHIGANITDLQGFTNMNTLENDLDGESIYKFMKNLGFRHENGVIESIDDWFDRTDETITDPDANEALNTIMEEEIFKKLLATMIIFLNNNPRLFTEDKNIKNDLGKTLKSISVPSISLKNNQPVVQRKKFYTKNMLKNLELKEVYQPDIRETRLNSYLESPYASQNLDMMFPQILNSMSPFLSHMIPYIHQKGGFNEEDLENDTMLKVHKEAPVVMYRKIFNKLQEELSQRGKKISAVDITRIETSLKELENKQEEFAKDLTKMSMVLHSVINNPKTKDATEKDLDDRFAEAKAEHEMKFRSLNKSQEKVINMLASLTSAVMAQVNGTVKKERL